MKNQRIFQPSTYKDGMLFFSFSDNHKKSLKFLWVIFFFIITTFFIRTIFAAKNLPNSHNTKILTSKSHESQKGKNTFSQALFHGKWILDLRPRFEWVKQNNALLNAEATTLRSLLGYRTGEYKGFSLFGQAEYVTRLASQTYNSGAGTSPSKTQYSTIADPDVFLLNQLYLNFNTIGRTRLRVGRQIINLDNQRFIGAVGFRQNDQTFDAVSVKNTHIAHLKLFYAHISEVNRIFGPDATLNRGRQSNDTNLFNASYSAWRYGTVTGYIYSIYNKDNSSFSTNTYGIRFHGEAPLKQGDLVYVIEYAHQNNAFNNPISYDAYYTHIGFGVKAYNILVRGDQEILSGHNNLAGGAFQTPLATLHKFQGWNDVFLTTPDTGIIDSYLTLKATIKPLYHIKITIMHHYFSSETTSVRFGEEIDSMISKTWRKKYTLSLAYGNFCDANTPYVNTEKVWTTFTAHIPL